MESGDSVHCWAHWAGWGAFLGGKFYILGVAEYNKPIWDVLALEGEREEAARAYRQSQINQIFSQLGKRCQMGLLGLGFAAGLVGLGFSLKKMCIVVITVYLHTIYYVLNVLGGENGWMA